MNGKIAFITAKNHPGLMQDDDLAAQSLRRRGLKVEPVAWGEELSAFSAAVFRSCSDYANALAEFFSWLDEINKLGLMILNSPLMVKENVDKAYLIRLQELGVNTIPTIRLEPGEIRFPRDIFRFFNTSEIVLKPAVATSGINALRLCSSVEPGPSVTDLLNSRPMLIQPFVPQIIDGEVSFVFFRGKFSHAVKKSPAVGEFRVQPRYGGTRVAFTPNNSLLRQAELVLDGIGEKSPCYARVDGVVVDDRLLLMELELIEPCLFLGMNAFAPDRFSDAIEFALTWVPRFQGIQRNDRGQHISV